ncbi:MAG: hypothetical protein HND55_00510 [Pseudomonadota bacterium]|nr:MAG: hypothetical protein HND55_00510 [Pseudomonadota bacterium]
MKVGNTLKQEEGGLIALNTPKGHTENVLVGDSRNSEGRQQCERSASNRAQDAQVDYAPPVSKADINGIYFAIA